MSFSLSRSSCSCCNFFCFSLSSSCNFHFSCCSLNLIILSYHLIHRFICNKGRRTAEHDFQIINSLGYIFKGKEHPADKNTDDRIDMSYKRRRFIQILQQEKLFDYQQDPVKDAPQHIVPACSMPKAC